MTDTEKAEEPATTPETTLTQEERSEITAEARQLCALEPTDDRGHIKRVVGWADDVLRYDAALTAAESQLAALRKTATARDSAEAERDSWQLRAKQHFDTGKALRRENGSFRDELDTARTTRREALEDCQRMAEAYNAEQLKVAALRKALSDRDARIARYEETVAALLLKDAALREEHGQLRGAHAQLIRERL